MCVCVCLNKCFQFQTTLFSRGTLVHGLDCVGILVGFGWWRKGKEKIRKDMVLLWSEEKEDYSGVWVNFVACFLWSKLAFFFFFFFGDIIDIPSSCLKFLLRWGSLRLVLALSPKKVGLEFSCMIQNLLLFFFQYFSIGVRCWVSVLGIELINLLMTQVS